jgi:membrane-associated phospholipid phosphatase
VPDGDLMPPSGGAEALASPPRFHNKCIGTARVHRGLFAVLGLVLAPRPIVGQGPAAPYRVTLGDAASVGAAGVLYLLPGALGLPHGGPSCAPCDPVTLPGVDRWALRPVSATGDAASDVVLAGVAGFTAFAGLHGLPAQQWQGNLAVFANAASWTAASTEWLKVLIRRKRPVLYTSGALGAASDPESQQSLPSLHASLAFAAATSYVVIARREHLPHRTRNTLLLYAGAVGVAVLRVAAGKHFPTDVLASAALGSGIGWVVPTIHPTQP